MSTSVVIVTCRRHPWLVPCLESVLGQADEVVLVDNASPEGWAAAEARRLGARVVSPGKNLGFPGGVNAGLKVATGDVVALLNDDALAGQNWLKQASAALEDPTVAAVAPKLLLMWPHAEINFDDEPWYAPGDPRPLGRELHEVTVAGEDVLPALSGAGVHKLETSAGTGGPGRRWRWTVGNRPFYVPLAEGATASDLRVNGDEVDVGRVVDLINNAGSYLSAEAYVGDYGYETPDGPHFTRPAERFAACGAAMSVRAETFRRLGGFASAYFAYYEDADWSWRAQLASLRVLYEPAATVRHVRSVSTGGAENPMVRFLAARNRLHTLARNAPLGMLRWQLRRAREPDQPLGLVRALATRIPRGLAERRQLARHWDCTPGQIFNHWAGLGEEWPV